MKTVKSLLTTVAAVAALAGLTITAMAATASKAPKEQVWSFTGFFGTFDRAELQRGFHVYKDVCSACHGLNLVAFRNLQEIGLNEAEVKQIAADWLTQIRSGPDADGYEVDDDGEFLTRPPKPSDKIPSPFANDNAARAANGGALPPDLSLMAKARHNGPDYIYSLLTGYEDVPSGGELPPGMSYNPYFPGDMIAMAAPLFEDSVEYADGTPASIEQMSKDLSVFLMWAAEPGLEARKSLGYKVIIFLLVFTILMYFSNKRVWAKLKEED